MKPHHGWMGLALTLLLGASACDGVATQDGIAMSTASGAGIEPGDGGTVGTGGGTVGTGGGTVGTGGGSARLPAGWLFTQGNKVHVSDGNGGGPVWVGRGVNVDDIFHCGYNNSLWMPDGEAALTGLIGNLMRDWKPTFLRMSLAMNTYTPVSWSTNPAQYATPMTNVIQSIAAFPGAYVLVTLRSDASMTRLCTPSSDATCLPTTATSADGLYRQLVNTFANSPHVLFGVTNEPGGWSATDADLAGVMAHAVSVIRAEEDRLGTPHHVVAVQGNGWSSQIGFYDAAPLPFDGVVYEYHSYPPKAADYTWAHLPVIIGEYGPDFGVNADQGTMASAAAFHADVEAKQIPSLAWDLSPYSNCAPDLVARTMSTTLTPTPWGATVKSYLLAH